MPVRQRRRCQGVVSSQNSSIRSTACLSYALDPSVTSGTLGAVNGARRHCSVYALLAPFFRPRPAWLARRWGMTHRKETSTLVVLVGARGGCSVSVPAVSPHPAVTGPIPTRDRRDPRPASTPKAVLVGGPGLSTAAWLSWQTRPLGNPGGPGPRPLCATPLVHVAIETEPRPIRLGSHRTDPRRRRWVAGTPTHHHKRKQMASLERHRARSRRTRCRGLRKHRAVQNPPAADWSIAAPQRLEPAADRPDRGHPASHLVLDTNRQRDQPMPPPITPLARLVQSIVVRLPERAQARFARLPKGLVVFLWGYDTERGAVDDDDLV